MMNLLCLIQFPIPFFLFLGVITKIGANSGVIDKAYAFNIDHTTISNLKVGTKVLYLAYIKENGELTIKKIISAQDEAWDKNDNQIADKVSETDQEAVFDVHTRTTITKVMAKIGRSILLDNITTTCDLDKIKCTFIPENGDVVKIDAVYQTDNTSYALAGEVIAYLIIIYFLKIYIHNITK